MSLLRPTAANRPAMSSKLLLMALSSLAASSVSEPSFWKVMPIWRQVGQAGAAQAGNTIANLAPEPRLTGCAGSNRPAEGRLSWCPGRRRCSLVIGFVQVVVGLDEAVDLVLVGERCPWPRTRSRCRLAGRSGSRLRSRWRCWCRAGDGDAVDRGEVSARPPSGSGFARRAGS